MSLPAVPHHDRFVAVPGGELFVRRWAGAESGPPLILLHDSLGCVDLWGTFPADLVRVTGRTVVAYDRLGYGRSSPRRTELARDFIREEAEIFFPRVVAELGLDRFCLMGHSVGGGMAVTIAALEPARCAAVISESAQALIEDKTIAGILAARASFEDPSRFARLTAVHGDKAAEILRAWSDAWLNLKPMSWSLTRDLPQLRCPLLILHGDADEFGSLASPDALADYGGSRAQRIILAGCGHIPHRERRDEVLTAIKDFLI